MDARLDTLQRLWVAAIKRGDVAECDKLEDVLDNYLTEQHFDSRKPARDMAPVALWYAERGALVFPIRPMSKIPYPESHGFKDATTDTDQVMSWWTEHPKSNIGYATGHQLDVVDIDGERGNKSMCVKLEESPDFPVIHGIAFTPRPGGMHLFIKSTGLHNTQAWHPGIDYRGIGGYVVLPPSQTEHGAYRWIWMQGT